MHLCLGVKLFTAQGQMLLKLRASCIYVSGSNYLQLRVRLYTIHINVLLQLSQLFFLAHGQVHAFQVCVRSIYGSRSGVFIAQEYRLIKRTLRKIAEALKEELEDEMATMWQNMIRLCDVSDRRYRDWTRQNKVLEELTVTLVESLT